MDPITLLATASAIWSGLKKASELVGEAQLHVSTLDIPGGVGLFEIGKHLLIEQAHDGL